MNLLDVAAVFGVLALCAGIVVIGYLVIADYILSRED